MCENCKLNEVIIEKTEQVATIKPKNYCDCGCDDECVTDGCECE